MQPGALFTNINYNIKQDSDSNVQKGKKMAYVTYVNDSHHSMYYGVLLKSF